MRHPACPTSGAPFLPLFRTLFLSIFLAAVALPALAVSQAASPNGILLVAFGTSMDEAKPALDAVGQAFEKAHPGTPVVWAYTSDIIRRKLAGEGRPVFSVREALDHCSQEGIVSLRVQSLHVTVGEEYSWLERVIVRYLTDNPGKFKDVWLGHPLLESTRDLDEVVDAALNSLPKDRKATDAVVFMAHGNDRGPGDIVLAHLACALQERDKLVFLAAVEGANDFAGVLEKVKASGAGKVYLQPFMMVAGDHAWNDLAGSEDDSWASILKANGLEVEASLIGLGQIPGVQAVLVRHAGESTDELVHPKKIY